MAQSARPRPRSRPKETTTDLDANSSSSSTTGMSTSPECGDVVVERIDTEFAARRSRRRRTGTGAPTRPTRGRRRTDESSRSPPNWRNLTGEGSVQWGSGSEPLGSPVSGGTGMGRGVGTSKPLVRSAGKGNGPRARASSAKGIPGAGVAPEGGRSPPPSTTACASSPPGCAHPRSRASELIQIVVRHRARLARALPKIGGHQALVVDLASRATTTQCGQARGTPPLLRRRAFFRAFSSTSKMAVPRSRSSSNTRS